MGPNDKPDEKAVGQGQAGSLPELPAEHRPELPAEHRPALPEPAPKPALPESERMSEPLDEAKLDEVMRDCPL